MPASPVTCPQTNLPRELDVTVNISRPQTEIATDMTLMCVCTPNVEFNAGNDRVRYYSVMPSNDEIPATSTVYGALQAFFAQTTRPSRIAVGRIFTSGTQGRLVSGVVNVSALSAIENGGFDISIGGVLIKATGLDFSEASTIAAVASVVDTAITAQGSCTNDEQGRLIITTNAAGDGNEIEYAVAPTAEGSPTDVSALLMLTEATASSNTVGYTPGDIVSELELIKQASRCNGAQIYAWALDNSYRDTEDQKLVADWAETQTPAWFTACTNSAQAYNSSDDTNIGYYANSKGYSRTSVIYGQNSSEYPDVSYAARMLAVNYSLPNSAITMKFKDLPGITPVGLTESQLQALTDRRINCLTLIGNNSRTVREGVQSADTWFTDSLVALDNFREELQVEVYNVFLRNPKVPYTSAGQDLIVSACTKICNRYTRNGVFGDRDEETTENESGLTTRPATSIEPVNVAYATASDRASRVGPPVMITAYEAGAIHKTTINVDVYN